MTQFPTVNSATSGATTPDRLNDVNIDDFLKLMIAELQNQDPLNPLDNDELVAQIGQIRSVGATEKLTDTLDSVLLGQNISSATNLIGAVKAAGEAPFAEVGLAMHENPSDTIIAIHRSNKVRKCHTSRRDTFKSINSFPIARVENLKVSMATDSYQKRDPNRKLVLKPDFCDKVALVKFYPGLDPAVIDFYVERGFRGILLEGTGLGHVSKFCFEAIQRATAKGVVVALASQCIWGRVDMNVYDTGRDLLSFGVIPLEDMFPETGLVKLMWVLGQTSDPKEAAQLMQTNIAGEISPRTLPQDKVTVGGKQ